ncbi:MAG: acyltransferase family protein [Bacteroidales bacterium]|nr:acyltransferase family protein [Bacteroidales bacterium]
MRNPLISALQIIGILLVVLGHALINYEDTPLYRWIYSFHMPLFMALSGALFGYSCRRKGISPSSIPFWGEDGIVRSKVRRLLLPFFVISTITFPIKALLSRYALRPVEMTLTSYLHGLLYPWEGTIVYLWFLPTLFGCFILFVGTTKLLNMVHYPQRVWIIMVMSFCLAIFNPFVGREFLCIGSICQYWFYFCFGYVSMNLFTQPWSVSHSTTTLFLMLAIGASCMYWVSDLAVWKIFIACVGIMMCVCCAQVYNQRGHHFFDFLYGSSFTIYLLSWYPQTFCGQFLPKVVELPLPLYCFLSMFLGVLVPWLVYKGATIYLKDRFPSHYLAIMGI